MDSSAKPVTYRSVAGPQYKYTGTDNVKIGGSSTTEVLPKVTTSFPAGDDSFWGSEQRPPLCLSAWAFSSSPLTPQQTKCQWSNCTFRCCAVLPRSLFIMHERWIYSHGADSFFLDSDIWCVPLSDHVDHWGTKSLSVFHKDVRLVYAIKAAGWHRYLAVLTFASFFVLATVWYLNMCILMEFAWINRL